MHETHEPFLVCLNGHNVNEATITRPRDSVPFCERCGAKTIKACPICNAAIPGRYVPARDERVLTMVGMPPPRYCTTCGNAFPWTEAGIQAAVELLVESAGADESKLRDDFKDLTSETPRTPLAAHRLKNLLAKAGPSVSEAIRGITVNVIAEGVKKLIWPV